MTKEIPLTQGKVAIVDNDVYEWASQWKWYAQKHRNTYYVRRGVWQTGKVLSVNLHREIMNAPKGVQVDHINGDGLDNRRSNLRLATNTENSCNQSKQSNNTSGFKGVYWHKVVKKWQVCIRKNYHLIYIGYYNTPEEAALAYDKAALEHFGEFAKTNYDIGLLG